MQRKTEQSAPPAQGPLVGINVLEIGMLFAGPMASAYLADLGADVIKIEPLKGDEVRRMGRSKNDEPLWWRVTNRGKQLVAADIRHPAGAAVVRRIAATADVLIENFRPGKLAGWGLDYETLSALNPGLVMLHISGYGQTGPYSSRPGMGTLAEAFSGFAHTTGEADGPPTLPAYPIADGVAAMTGAMSVLAALVNRSRNGGIGDDIEISLYEPMLSLLGAMAIDYDQLGVIGRRRGNRSTWTTPRNTYQSSDHRWIAVSAAANSGARRLFNAIGRSDLAARPDLQTNPQRMLKLAECDGAVADWVRRHTLQEVLDVFERAGVVAGPVYDVEQLFTDRHVIERETFIEIDDAVLGKLRIQGVVPRFRRAPGKVRWPGRPKVGQDTREILARFDYSDDEVEQLLREEAIRL
ncbi:CoA transferase [Verticiella sediminum]|uniref:CoA transferase n=1 Tax=Verticiella sediminum TaxID=1247510 RepID=A0A556ATP7_9BURK|nr:CoA transferase [Verticiella sediminum]TSH96300.1 CoA transferase [Verticiella sediminum]